jgi:hypothetical protein
MQRSSILGSLAITTLILLLVVVGLAWHRAWRARTGPRVSANAIVTIAPARIWPSGGSPWFRNETFQAAACARSGFF